MTPATEQNLQAYRQGDRQAGEALLRAHDRFIRSVVLRYGKKSLDLPDLMQVGRMSFLLACQRYDPARDASILTYARHYIRGYVLREIITTGAVVRFPVNHYKKGHPQRRYTRARYVYTFTEMTDLFHEFSRFQYEDTTTDDRPLAEEALGEDGHEHKIPRAARWALGGLTPREQDVLRRRFGEEPESLDSIGRSYDLTRERVRQIEAQALTRLRARMGLTPPPQGPRPPFWEWVEKIANHAEGEPVPV